MKKFAKQLAAQGRHGDTELLHVSREELASLHGLGSLFGKRITRNPSTGLPEAFDFKSLLPAAVGIGATVLSGGTLSPLALGLMSGATSAAMTGDLNKGLTTGLMTGMTAGLGQGLMGVANSGAAGAATGDAVAQGMTTAAVPSMTGQTAAGMFSQGAGTAGQLGSGYAGALGNTAADTLGQAGTAAGANFGNLGSGFANVGHDMAGSLAGSVPAGAGAGAGAAASGWTDPAAWKAQFGGDMLMKRTVPGLLALGSMAQSGMEPDGFEEEQPSEDAKKEKRMSRTVTGASDPYYAMRPGGEHNYFSAPTYFAEGGIVSLPNGQQADNGTLKVVRAIRSRYRSRKAAVEDMQVPNSFMQRLGLQDPNDPVLDYAFGYTKKQGNRQLKSGIMTLAEGGAIEPVGIKVQKPKPPFRYMDAPGKPAAPRDGMPVLDDKGVTAEPVQVPRKRPNRTMMASGGAVQGPGDGMSDSIPATIEGQQPARLARDEFVVPSDVVSGLGNGSSKAGHEQLYDMVARIRAARTGKTQQAPALNPKKVLPR